MTKVGEHITLDIIGTTQEYKPAFFEKIVYKIAKNAGLYSCVVPIISNVMCSPTLVITPLS